MSEGRAGDSERRQSELAAARRQVEQTLRSLAESTSAAAVGPLTRLPQTNDLESVDREQDIRLKSRYARVLLWLLGSQLFIADAVFIIFAALGPHWKLSATVINVWLGATLVEVVGIVLVVTRYLFPRRDTQV